MNPLPLSISIALLAAFVMFLCLIVWRQLARPKNLESCRQELQRMIERLRARPGYSGTGLTVLHPATGFKASFGADAETSLRVFHAASVGKLFTATLAARLVEEGCLDWNTRVAEHLPPEELEGLFDWEGIDHSGEVTLAMLLSHTSGVADYFGDRSRSGKILSSTLGVEPQRFWTVQELLDYSRREQVPVGPPGVRYHYSDTGYLLLGRIIEVLRGYPFHEVLRREIFEPTGMKDAYMPLRESPPPGAPPLRPALLHGTDLSRAEALSADWAGGGVALTAADLLSFCMALYSGSLLRPETLRRMADFRWRFRSGVGYGLGLMELRFGEFFPLLKSWPPMIGHMGILGIQCFWNPIDGTIIVVSLCNDRGMAASVKLLIEALGVLRRIPV